MSLRSNVLSPPEITGYNEPRLSSFSSTQHPFYEEHNDIVSTKTTTIVDPYGNTQSVTTETIRALPDGSSVLEKTTQFSKPGSRCNSARSQTRTNTIIDKRSMSRIDEELNNFAYSYLDERSPSMTKSIHKQAANPGLNQDTSALDPKPACETKSQAQNVDESEKRLKSILKKTQDLGQLNDSTNITDSVNENFVDNDCSPKVSENLDFQDSKDYFQTERPTNSFESKLTREHEQKDYAEAFEDSKIPKIKFAPSTNEIKGTNSFRSKLQQKSDSANSFEVVDHERGENGLKYDYTYQNHHRKFRAHSLRSNSRTYENTLVNLSALTTNRLRGDQGFSKHHSKTEGTEFQTNSMNEALKMQGQPQEKSEVTQVSSISHIPSQNDSPRREKVFLSKNGSNKPPAITLNNGLGHPPSEEDNVDNRNSAIELNELNNGSSSQRSEADKKRSRFKAFVHKFISG